MKIALLAPFEEPVPPIKYGGTERVVYYLAEGLVQLGHDVTLFASGGSKTSAKLVPCITKPVRTSPQAHNARTRQTANLRGLIKAASLIRQEEYDIVHNHFGWEALLFSELIKHPMVTTVHGSMAEPITNYMHALYKSQPIVSISNSQRLHAKNLNYVGTVYNGIDPSGFSFGAKPKDYLMFLGRIHPQKGPAQAIKIAKAAGRKLIMAAKIDPAEEGYFKKTVEPLIDGKQIVFVREPAEKHKIALLKSAYALIAPIQWDEPFGMVNIEALACGVPVITIKRGSTSEIIIDGKVGYLCRDTKQMIKRVEDVGKISRRACRDHVSANFTAEKMAKGYEQVYKKLIKRL
ncbi:hypothetical protein A3D14_01520 [Candidatus Saccharibacteria bacterium RIFCSPHIGHO2_02_FULL_47_12]|nr:MAG: hypothetical protein A3D14_01520 [Candidatus Saccharibacteria bacterium RIFCSPHIGHO2_02_FULL_47_12]